MTTSHKEPEVRLLYLHNETLDFQRANVLQVLNMCKAFADHGVQTTLALADSGLDADGMKKVIASEFGPVRDLRVMSYRKVTVANRLKILGSYHGVRSLLRHVTADICFVRDPLMCVLAVRAGLPTMYESHNARFQNRSTVLNGLWERQMRRVAGRPNFVSVVPISEALASVWRTRGIPDRQILTLHDGFDANLFSTPMTQMQARAKLGLPPEGPLIVYTGSLYKDRGIPSILHLASQMRQCKFLVVGGPDDARRHYQSEAIAGGLQNIFFTGRVAHTQIPTYLAAADVLLMIWSAEVPTINYCSPMKVFEYMAAGRIIVGHGFPTIREVLEDGATAYLADPQSIDDLQSKLELAIADGYPSPMAERARQQAFGRFSWFSRAGAVLEHWRNEGTAPEAASAKGTGIDRHRRRGMNGSQS